MKVMGIDPGSQATGYGVVQRAQNKAPRHLAHGVLRPPQNAQPPARLLHIQQGIANVISAHKPDCAVMEKIFVHAANPRSALVLGQARGAALCACEAAGLPLYELTPQQIKSAVTGVGNAPKSQVQRMVARLLSLPKAPPQDAADALAAAICHANFPPNNILALAAAAAGAAAAPRKRARRASAGWAVRRAQ